ncbi:MAG TPA: sigma-70 family RNA polymerase sigma factor [Candidatus Limnocylindrales bacterium]
MAEGGSRGVSSSGQPPNPGNRRPDAGDPPIDAPRDPGIHEAPKDDLEARRVVAAVLGGDRDAFRVLVERESRALVRSCYRVLGDLHDAEDAAQEAFVTAYRALGTWRGDGPFGAWLARIGVRIAVRKASRRRPVAWIDPSPMVADGDRADVGRTNVVGERALLAALGRAEADPAQLAIRAERAASIRAAVANLEEPYREVVALRFFSELSLAEIADEAGRPLGTVKTHLHRGLQRLRRALEAQGVA